jgi:iron-sulfur cluster assembly protein
MPAPAMTITEAAADQVRAMIAGRDAPSEGVRLGVRTGGCSGMAYTLEFADESTEFDEKIEGNGVTVFIDPKALMFVVGTEMDYVEGGMESGFVFNNPNEKARCGCGESFHV